MYTKGPEKEAQRTCDRTTKKGKIPLNITRVLDFVK